MKTGILHQMWAPASVSDRQCLQEATDDVRLADELGYESFWFGEHHFNRNRPFFGRVPMPELVIARLAAETKQIRLGTGVKVLPLETGARFAEKMSLLDLLTDGRAEFGVGEGTPGSFFTEDKRTLFRQSLIELVAFLRGQQGEDQPDLTPAPLRDLTGLIWTAVRNWESIELTAQLGLNFATGQLDLGPDQRVWVDMYHQAGGTGEARGYRLVLVAESTDEAERLAAPAREFYYSASRGGGGHAAESMDPVEFRRANFIVGTPATVGERLLAYKDEAGLDRVDLLAHVPGLEPEAVRQTLTLFAHEVAPLMDVEMLVPAST
jgi:alkanesulfonate monooxygenase SsuD/methylene tetrahydromethanopterin reductase-like flavin-dependent oxidoreductase (luciferase family)